MNKICIGTIVQVKETFIDETTGQNIAGWKGRVRLIFDPTAEQPDAILFMEWTAETIRQMPDSFILRSYESEAAWTVYYLPSSEVVPLAESHSEIESEWTKEAVCRRIFWPLFGREGRIMENVFKNDELPADEFPLRYWYEFLRKNLTFPIKGSYDNPEEDDGEEENPLQTGDRIRLTDLSGWGYPLGVLCECEAAKDNRKYIVPLQDIDNVGTGVSKNDRYLVAYNLWMICRN